MVRLLGIKRFAGCMMRSVVVTSEGGSENVRGLALRVGSEHSQLTTRQMTQHSELLFCV